MKNPPMQTEERLKTIIKHAPTGLVEIDQNGSVIHLNLKGEALLKQVLTSVNFDDNNFFPVLAHIAPELAEKIKSQPHQTGAIATNEIHHFPVSINGEKTERYFQFSVTRLYTDCISVAFDDVTDKSNDETMLQLVLDKAVEQDKFNFSANVLHDIGNAVVGFGSYVNRIKRSAEETNPESLQSLAGFFQAQQPAIAAGGIGEAKAGAVLTMLNTIATAQKINHDEIKKSITEQLNIITHIQEILNIQRQYVSGNESHENKPTHIRGIINDCMSMLFAAIEKRGIILSLNIPVELPVIMCNRTRLMQVILNILKNSIEAIDMTATKKTISLNVFVHENLLVLQIHDNGCGFDEATGKKLFERGFTTKSSGTGLGLNSCRAIIESFDGGIDVTSDGPGKGALTIISFKI